MDDSNSRKQQILKQLMVERELRKKMAQETKPNNYNHQIMLFNEQTIPKPKEPEAADYIANNTIVAADAVNSVETQPVKEKLASKYSTSMSMVQKMLDQRRS